MEHVPRWHTTSNYDMLFETLQSEHEYVIKHYRFLAESLIIIPIDMKTLHVSS